MARPSDPTERVSYTIRIPEPHTHYAEIEARVPARGREDVELMMAVWTPGSYLVREYSRHVEAVSATGAGGKALAVEKTRKNRWRIATGGAKRILVRYRLYCHDMSVRGNWIDSEFALLNGAPTFLVPADPPAEGGYEIRMELPKSWSTSLTPLPEAPGGRKHRYIAADYDTLVDSPIACGNPALYRFRAAGRPHILANVGENGVWDGPRSKADVEKIVREHLRMWGGAPYRRYIFFNLLTEGRGGLEHKESCVLMASRWATRTRKKYLQWLELVSHEFFHTWNVKRLRPEALGPFPYEEEAYTKSLWVAEGFTEYFGGLAVRRAGLASDEEYLESLSRHIERLETTPGRHVQPLSLASFDAWIKLYRPDENTVNTAISYYTKGAVVAFLLDAKIRRLTNGRRSLDDVMRLAYERYSGARGYTEEEFRETASEVAGKDLGRWFAEAVDGTSDLDYTEALKWFGLRFAPAPRKDGKDSGAAKGGAKESKGRAKAWLGARIKEDGGRVIVTQVLRDTPAYEAGINAGDEIVAIDEYRIPPGGWAERLECYAPGEKVSVLVARRGKLVRLKVQFAAEPSKSWRLEIDPKAPPEAKRRRKAWLSPRRAF